MFGFFSKTTKTLPIIAQPEPIPEPFKPHSPIELKIKALSLTAEAGIIKRLERRLKKKKIVARENGFDPKNQRLTIAKTYGPSPLLNPKRAAQFFTIQGHRKKEIRDEARATHLARAFLKGRPYCEVEQKAYKFPLTMLKVKVEAMVKKYGQGDQRIIAQKFEEWCQEGEKYWDFCWER